MTVRPVNIDPNDHRVTQADACLARSFYEDRGGNGPTREMLPSLGFIVEAEDSYPLACSFCYLDGTGSGVAHLAWIASNPLAPMVQRGEAVKHAIMAAIAAARDLNYWAIMATFQDGSIADHLRDIGFLTGDTNSVHLYHTLTT